MLRRLRNKLSFSFKDYLHVFFAINGKEKKNAMHTEYKIELNAKLVSMTYTINL